MKKATHLALAAIALSVLGLAVGSYVPPKKRRVSWMRARYR